VGFPNDVGPLERVFGGVRIVDSGRNHLAGAPAHSDKALLRRATDLVERSKVASLDVGFQRCEAGATCTEWKSVRRPISRRRLLDRDKGSRDRLIPFSREGCYQGWGDRAKDMAKPDDATGL